MTITHERAVADGVPPARLYAVAAWHQAHGNGRHLRIAHKLRVVARALEAENV